VLTEANDEVSENMVRWALGLNRETIVLVEGKVQIPPENQGEIKTTTVHQRELKIEKVRVRAFDISALLSPVFQLHVISHPTVNLPFQVEDVSKPAEFYEQVVSVGLGERSQSLLFFSTREPPRSAILPVSTTACLTCV
jgi:hypothetical protein